MFAYLNKKGQATLEYGIIIAVIVAGLIAMQVYIKRGFQGKLRQASDDMGEQFSPGYTTGTHTATTTASSTENITGGSQSTTSSSADQSQSRSVNETVAAFSNEYWSAP